MDITKVRIIPLITIYHPGLHIFKVPLFPFETFNKRTKKYVEIIHVVLRVINSLTLYGKDKKKSYCDCLDFRK